MTPLQIFGLISAIILIIAILSFAGYEIYLSMQPSIPIQIPQKQIAQPITTQPLFTTNTSQPALGTAIANQNPATSTLGSTTSTSSVLTPNPNNDALVTSALQATLQSNIMDGITQNTNNTNTTINPTQTPIQQLTTQTPIQQLTTQITANAQATVLKATAPAILEGSIFQTGKTLKSDNGKYTMLFRQTGELVIMPTTQITTPIQFTGQLIDKTTKINTALILSLNIQTQSISQNGVVVGSANSLDQINVTLADGQPFTGCFNLQGCMYLSGINSTAKLYPLQLVTTWSSDTSGIANSRSYSLRVNSNEVSILDGDQSSIWSIPLKSSDAVAKLVVDSIGNLNVLNANDTVLWSSANFIKVFMKPTQVLKIGQLLYSQDGQSTFGINQDGWAQLKHNNTVLKTFNQSKVTFAEINPETNIFNIYDSSYVLQFSIGSVSNKSSFVLIDSQYPSIILFNYDMNFVGNSPK